MTIRRLEAGLHRVDRMQKASHGRVGQIAPRLWLSTALGAIRPASLAGRLFSAGSVEDRGTGEAIIKSFEGVLKDILHPDDRNDSAAFTDLPATPANITCGPSIVRESGRSNRERVVLFVPEPVTEARLLRENVKRATTIRLRQRRRRRLRWLTDNIGTIVFVMGLFVVAWFVAAS